jgi:oxygen-independent coproporphyrinogen-3 oxidase
MSKLGIYVHLALCKQKCRYCDFASLPNPGLSKVYSNALIKNIHALNQEFSLRNRVVDSIFIGGGTPSLFSMTEISSILTNLREQFQIEDSAEISIEINPESATIEKLEFYKSIGINRVSIGVQTFHETILKEIGRLHTPEEAIKIVVEAKKLFRNISVDLMFGLPSQTLEDFETDLKKLIHFDIPHVSAYMLTQDEDNPIWEPEHLPPEKTIPNFFQKTNDLLKLAGIHKYEISNYAKPGFECRHNIGYWTQKEYIGFGAAAHSYLKHPEKIRFENLRDVNLFMKSVESNQPTFNMTEKLSQNEDKFDFITSGLRMTRGVSLKNYKKEYGTDLLNDFENEISANISNEMITVCNNSVSLTEKGRLFSDNVFLDFVRL